MNNTENESNEELEIPSPQMVVQYIDENGVKQTWLPSDYIVEHILYLKTYDDTNNS